MNERAYGELSSQEQAWVDASSGRKLSLRGVQAYVATAARGLVLAQQDGIEFITMPDEELDKIYSQFSALSCPDLSPTRSVEPGLIAPQLHWHSGVRREGEALLNMTIEPGVRTCLWLHV